jgi:hypothetical protein
MRILVSVPKGRLLEGDFEVVAQIGTAIDIRTTAATATPAEDLVERCRRKASEKPPAPAAPMPACGIDTGVTVLVVGRTLLRVGEDLVGFLDFLEVLLGLGIVRIAVRMVLHRQLAVGLLDFFIGCVAIDAENVVKVAFSHRF